VANVYPAIQTFGHCIDSPISYASSCLGLWEPLEMCINLKASVEQ